MAKIVKFVESAQTKSSRRDITSTEMEIAKSDVGTYLILSTCGSEKRENKKVPPK